MLAAALVVAQAAAVLTDKAWFKMFGLDCCLPRVRCQGAVQCQAAHGTGLRAAPPVPRLCFAVQP